MINTLKITWGILLGFLLLFSLIPLSSAHAGSFRVVPFGVSNSACTGPLAPGAGTYKQREDVPINDPNVSGLFPAGEYTRAKPFPSGFSTNPQNFCFEVSFSETQPNGNTNIVRGGGSGRNYVPYSVEIGTWHSGSGIQSLTPSSNYSPAGQVKRHAYGSAAATFKNMYCEDTYSPQMCTTSQQYVTYDGRTCSGGTEVFRQTGTLNLLVGQQTGAMTSFAQAQTICTQQAGTCCALSSNTTWSGGEPQTTTTHFVVYEGNSTLVGVGPTSKAIKLSNVQSCTGGRVSSVCTDPGQLPTVSLTANPSSIAKGVASSTLTWSSQNALTCSSQDFDTKGALSGSVDVSPLSTKTYNVQCRGYTQPPSGGTTGTWKHYGNDVSDFSCPLLSNNLAYTNIQWCPSSNPAGQSCSSTGGINSICKINVANTNACWIETTLYACVGGSSSSVSSTYPTANASAQVDVKAGLVRPPTLPPGGTSGNSGGNSGGGGGGQCSDTIDNDQDGLIDLLDPDCSGGGSVENSAPLPECSDGIDNDGDGKIDFPSDRACPSAQGDDEEAPDAILSLSAFPSPTRKDTATEITWETFNAESCVLSGNNGDSWILVGALGNKISSALMQETIFTLRCLNLDDVPFSTSITVKLLPSFGEQ